MKMMMITMAKIAIMMMRLKLTVKIKSYYGMWRGAQRYYKPIYTSVPSIKGDVTRNDSHQ